jgi:hypothetical protein
MTVQRADLADLLKPSRMPVKTFVLEVHSGEPEQLLRELDEIDSVEATGDAYIFKLNTGPGEVWVDTLDHRFWSFHTLAPMASVQPMLRRQVGARRDLDWMWLPSGHVGTVWPRGERQAVRTDFRGGLLAPGAATRDLRVQLRGRDAEQFLDVVSCRSEYRSALAFDSVQVRAEEPGLGVISELVSQSGRFLASGDSFELHTAIVGEVVAKYRLLIEEIESRRFSWLPITSADGGDSMARDTVAEDSGGTFQGVPILISFGRAILDLDAWMAEVFSAREPFRLWGRPVLLDDDSAEVEAVDLHIGQRFSVDVTRKYLRVYLPESSCGNTVTRLVSNLQHRFDGSLDIMDPAVRSLAYIQ